MRRYIPLSLVLFVSLSCSMKEGWEYDRELDFSPPVLLRMEVSESPEIDLSFDEPIYLPENRVLLDNGIEAVVEVKGENHLILNPTKDLDPGVPRTATLTVEDLKGNSNTFLIRFWGWNPRIPDTLINELNPQGSGIIQTRLSYFFKAAEIPQG